MAFLRILSERFRKTTRRNLKSAVFVVITFLMLLSTWGIPYVIQWRGHKMFNWRMPPIDYLELIALSCFLPLYGIFIMFDLLQQCLLAVTLISVLAFALSPFVTGLLKLHRSLATKTSKFLLGHRYTFGEKLFGYSILGLAFGTLGIVLATSPLLPLPTLGYIGIAQTIFSPLIKALLGEQLYSGVIGQPIWALGLVFFSLTPVCVFLAKIGLVTFCPSMKDDQIQKAVKILLVAIGASLLVVVQVIWVNLFPAAPDLQEFQKLWTYYVSMWLGMIALFSTSLLCSSLDHLVDRSKLLWGSRALRSRSHLST